MSVPGPLHSEPVRTALQRRPAWRSAPPVEISLLGADAGLFGAVLHALETTEAFAFTELTPEPAPGSR